MSTPIAKPLFRGLSHQFAFFTALGAGLVLIASAPSMRTMAAAAIYAATLAAMFGISAAYQRILGGVVLTGIFVLLIQWRESGSRNREERREQWRKAWPLVLLNGLSGPALGVSC